MPFEISPAIVINAPKTREQFGRIALADLAIYVRAIPDRLWDYEAVICQSDGLACGTVGCAFGHSMFVPSCQALGLIDMASVMSLNADEVFSIPERVSESIFFGGDSEVEDCPGYGCDMHDVTQAMVADRIDYWLRTGEIR